MAVGSLLLFFIGLVFLGIAVWRVITIQTYTFKNKKVLLQEKIMVLLGGLGIVILFCWMILAIF